MRVFSPRAVATGLVLVALLAFWLFFAPRQLGGDVSYIVTHGNSMEPRFEEDDLVIVRAGSDYEKGDLVAYMSGELDRAVFHRIVGVEAGRYVTKGDNNNWIDSDRPAEDQIIGELWLHVPNAGKVFRWFKSPFNALALIGLIAASIAWSNRARGERTGPAPRPAALPWAALSPGRQAALAVSGAVALASLAAAGYTLVRPPAAGAPARSLGLVHTGAFSYEAKAQKGPVYEDTSVTTGEPLFLALVDRATFRFDYELSSDHPLDVSGRVAMTAVVDTDAGWQRSIRLASRSFEGPQASVEGKLDLHAIRRLVERVQSITGVPQPLYTVTLRPKVTVRGAVAGEPVQEAFSPALAFQMDTYEMRLPPDAEAQAVLRPTRSSVVRATVPAAASPRIAGLDPSTLRVVLGALAAIALLAGALMARRWRSGAHVSEPEVIEALYGDLLVEVRGFEAAGVQQGVAVASMEELARLAESLDLPVLHDHTDGIHSYRVVHQGIAYYHQWVPPGTPVSPRASGALPPRAKAVLPAADDELARLRRRMRAGAGRRGG